MLLNCRYKGLQELTDDTDKFTGDNVLLIKLDPIDEHEVLNYGMELLDDYDFIHICDADELFSEEDIKRMPELCKEDYLTSKIYDYADETHIYEPRTHRPVVMVRPHVRFYITRCAYGAESRSDIIMHHYGYVDTDWKQEYWDDNGDQINSIKNKPKINLPILP